jgi:hypothetical protein
MMLFRFCGLLNRGCTVCVRAKCDAVSAKMKKKRALLPRTKILGLVHKGGEIVRSTVLGMRIQKLDADPKMDNRTVGPNSCFPHLTF